MLPSLEEQQFVSSRGCVFTACQFATRNYIAGDYLEFGVWWGGSFIHACRFLSKLRNDRIAWLGNRLRHRSRDGKADAAHEQWKQWKLRFFAFDSFEGLPDTGEQEADEEWVKGEYACSEAQFKKNLVKDGVDLKNVVTVPGFYDRSLNIDTKRRLGLERAAIVHIDCDIYESTILALDFVTDLLVQGSVIIFDDWFYNQARKDRGEQRACYEWLERNRHLELIPYWKDVGAASFIVNFKDKERAR
jgi:hypothetical protein